MLQRGLTEVLLACKIAVVAVAADFQRCSPPPPPHHHHSHRCRSQMLSLSPSFQMGAAHRLVLPHRLLLPHHCCHKDAADVEHGCDLHAS